MWPRTHKISLVNLPEYKRPSSRLRMAGNQFNRPHAVTSHTVLLQHRRVPPHESQSLISVEKAKEPKAFACVLYGSVREWNTPHADDYTTSQYGRTYGDRESDILSVVQAMRRPAHRAACRQWIRPPLQVLCL